MSAKVRWYHALPEVSSTVECGGERHTVTWRRGKLVLEHHDLTAERAMLAFGGEQCPCMQVLRLWEEQFGMPPELFGQMQTWLGANAFLAPKEMAVPRQLGMILNWERQWRRASYLGKHERLLQAELKERAVVLLRKHLTFWKQRLGTRVISGCDVKILHSDQGPAVTGLIDRVAARAVASLPPAWLVDVWPKGIAVVDEAFVLEVVGAESTDLLDVNAVRWKEQAPGRFTPAEGLARLSRGPDGSWELSWASR